MMKEIATEALTQISIALISLVCTYTLFYINKANEKLKFETQKIKDESQRALFQNALDDLNDVAAKAVIKLEQTIAKDLREAVKDGSVSKEELLKLSTVAYSEILAELKPDVHKLLQDNITDIKGYIINTIESNVYLLKKNSGGEK